MEANLKAGWRKRLDYGYLLAQYTKRYPEHQEMAQYLWHEHRIMRLTKIYIFMIVSHPFIQQKYCEFLPCARHCSICWECCSEKAGSLFSWKACKMITSAALKAKVKIEAKKKEGTDDVL